jgi:hypothetical protein
MKERLRFNIDLEFRKYIIQQLIIYFIITFFFFVLFLYNFGVIMAGFILWITFYNFLMYVYLDIKFSKDNYDLEKRIDNIEYIIRNIKK